MRTKLALRNTSISLLLEFLTALSGLIIPRLFTVTYGSSVNGLVSSISQFIVYMGLVEAGIGAAGTVKLYKPLAENNQYDINGIMSGARTFYYRSGILFILLDILLIIFYPILVSNQIADEYFVELMILVLSINGVVDYFFLGKYRLLLVADQRQYVLATFQIAGVVITTVASVVLIQLQVNAILVKVAVALVYILRTCGVVYYARKKYPLLDFTVPPRKEAFAQRSSALLHQIVGMICNSTDVVLLTVLLQKNSLVEVSVYSIYNLVSYSLTSLFNSISTGIRASFGQVISQKNDKVLNDSYSSFEYLFYIVLFTAYTCMGGLLLSFITLYSQDFQDAAVYPRVYLVVLFTACGIVQNIRIPGSTIQIAAGHFSETKNAAILEAVINLVVSLILIYPLGIAGVLIGTFSSYLFRSSYVIWYHNRYFLPGTLMRTVKRIIRCLIVSFMVLTFSVYNPLHITSWLMWFINALIYTLMTGGLMIFINAACEPEQFKKIQALVMKFAKRG